VRESLTVVTPPAIEPVTVGEAKAYARIDTADDDALIEALITAARTAAEEYTRRSFVARTLKLTLDLPCSGLSAGLSEGVYDLPVSALYGSFPSTIRLPAPPLLSITSVVTHDTANAATTLASSHYFADTAGGRLVFNDTAVLPSNLRPFAACEITYTAGYGATASAVPQPIRTAVLMHAQRMYDERVVCEMPPSCHQLLRQYRVYG